MCIIYTYNIYTIDIYMILKLVKVPKSSRLVGQLGSVLSISVIETS